MRSMTGYGRCSFKQNHFSINVEAKAVNHRFFECNPRIPQMFLSLEEDIQSCLHSKVKRGKIDLFIHIEKGELVKQRLLIDYDLLSEYTRIAEELKSTSQEIDGVLDINTLILQDQLVKKVEVEGEDLEEVKKMIVSVVEACVDSLIEMKSREGKQLKLDLFNQLNQMKKIILEIETKAPELNRLLQQKMQDRIAQSLADLNESIMDRIITEACIYAEKADINEELVRLQSHIAHFTHICDQEDYPIGRKLDFLVQEMNREVNTIGSKINDATIRQLVVSLKSYIEKIKEQVQNVE
ncbi:YicC/YloC family endoribonuclease [Alkalihalophilus sp. As8PL]|uniref:YicC/YloC family endoribonuclease n=1 Tax=Alkalihalophilus sp. As8PL TaxID=3237103 RepID=A0AB39BRL2_9BACI